MRVKSFGKYNRKFRILSPGGSVPSKTSTISRCRRPFPAPSLTCGMSHYIRKFKAVNLAVCLGSVFNYPPCMRRLQIICISTIIHHHHKHQRLDPSIRSVSTVTAARANASSVFQLFSFLVVCSGMISKGFGFVAFFASVKANSICIHLSCLVCL